jgi:hypothetical protein
MVHRIHQLDPLLHGHNIEHIVGAWRHNGRRTEIHATLPSEEMLREYSRSHHDIAIRKACEALCTTMDTIRNSNARTTHRHAAYSARRSWLTVEGLSLFPLQSLMNHDCNPNSIIDQTPSSPSTTSSSAPFGGQMDARHITVRATRDIAPNDEITMSYLPSHLQSSAGTKPPAQGDLPPHLQWLIRYHSFYCQCSVCKQWPLPPHPIAAPTTTTTAVSAAPSNTSA